MIRQLIFKEVCLKCQGCCRFAQSESIWIPRLLSKEKKRLKEIRLISNPQESNFLCAFLNTRNNRCRIYSFRPFECQFYPFILQAKNRKVILAVDLGCPFIKKKLETKEFKAHVQYLTNLLNQSDYQKLIKNNPQIIQEYEDVFILAELNLDYATEQVNPKR